MRDQSIWIKFRITIIESRNCCRYINNEYSMLQRQTGKITKYSLI